MNTINPLTYSQAATKVYECRRETRNLLHFIERKSKPLNYKQREFFERWLDEAFQVSNAHLFTRSYLDSKVDELLDQLKNLT